MSFTELSDKPEFYNGLRLYCDRVALIHGSRTITYAELDAMVEDFAQNFLSHRELVFLESHNEPQSIAAYLACLRYGHPVFLFGKEDGAKTDSLIAHYNPDRIVRYANGKIVQTITPQPPRAFADKLRVLLSTSGSTGTAKFVKLSAHNIDSNARSIVEYLNIGSDDRAITSLKFNYSFGMSVINSHLAAGAAIILTDKSVVEPEFWQLARDHQVTSLSGVPYTFELLQGLGGDWYTLPSLRYLAQAGGRLPASLVTQFATLGGTYGWNLFVMYGQTEASPRMAYLPPALASTYPDHIGVAIPGGQFSLIDENGQLIDSVDGDGHLAYSGPNVMMGYAQKPSDLANDETPPVLMTGDIARRNSEGLYKIVGRSARFLKPFGVRINLDDVERDVLHILPDAVCTGTDERIVIATADASSDALDDAIRLASERYNLPNHVFQGLTLQQIPRFESGKVDYQTILRHLPAMGGTHHAAGDPSLINAGFFKIIFSRQYAKQVIHEAARLIGIGQGGWDSIENIFRMFIKRPNINSATTFRDAGGDSLTYLQVSMALEEYLGNLPEGWDRMTIEELEGFRYETAI